MYLELLNASQSLGLDFVNTHMIQLADFLGKFVTEHSSNFTSVARSLGALFALIAISMELYKSIGRGEEIDVMALGRPFLFALLLGVWTPVCQALIMPGQLCEKHFQEVFEKQKDVVYELRTERMVTSWNLADTIRARRVAARQAEMAVANGTDGGMLELVEDSYNWLKDQLFRWTTILETFVANLFETLVMWLGELLWQCAIYYIFVTKNIFLCVLHMFGPIFVTASILPAWKDTWSKWVGRMITVSFYGVMAYIVMIFTLQIMVYTLEADIESMKNITSLISLGQYSSGLSGSSLLTLTAMFVGYKALMNLVPELAAWVFPGDTIHGASQFIGGMTGRTSGTAKSAGKMLVK